MSYRIRRAIAVSAVASVSSACATLLGFEDPPSPEQIESAAAELATLPSLTASEEALRTVVEQIVAAASAVAPQLRWSRHGDRDQGPCSGPFEQAGGVLVQLPEHRAECTLPDAEWPAFQQTARELAAEIGARTVQRGFREPPEYYVGFEGSEGRSWHNQTRVHITAVPGTVTITANVGCRIP